LSTVFAATGLNLRPATPEDARLLVALRNRLAEHFLSPQPATVEKTMELLDDSLTYVLEVDGRFAGGFALYRRRGDRLEFGRFMIEPWAAGNGYGRLMLEFAIEEARRLGARCLHLVTKPQNAAAFALYEDVGFRVTSMRMELNLA